MEGQIVYKKNEFIIFSVSNEFIVYNTKKEWKDGHTHLKNFKSSKNAIFFVIYNKIPRDHSFYYLTSLMRISNNEEYINKIDSLLQVKKNKDKNYYFNSNKGIKRRNKR